jgi:probable F420-dependent oxidoreductase
MKIDGMAIGGIDKVLAQAKHLEAQGYDGIGTAETGHDPFLSLAVVANQVPGLEIATSIAVAFARTPMVLAAPANDLQEASAGRFTLGLGSQIKPHIEKRFSMPWSHPAARMREFILALRAIWACWNDGEKLEFRGEFYTHTLMTPFFSPKPNPYGAPKVAMAAVGERMTEVAGEVADGLIVHPFTTAQYVQAVTLPALERGFAAGERTREQFEIAYPVFVVTGTDDETWDRARTGTKAQIAFYGSTPGYRGVLEQHGWGEVGDELNRLSKQGEWEAMGKLITDDMLDAFAVVAEPGKVADGIVDRWGSIVNRISFDAPYKIDPEFWRQLVDDIKRRVRS